MKNILLLIFFMTLVGCRQDSSPEDREPLANNNRFSDTIQLDYNRRVQLMPEARDEVSQWLAYATAQNEIERMRTATASEIIANSQPLVQIMELLQISLPDTLQASAVLARTNVLYSKARVLHQLSNKKNKDSEEIFEVAREMIVEFDNFKLQLNELFLKTPDAFEFDLDEELETRAVEDTLLPTPLGRQ